MHLLTRSKEDNKELAQRLAEHQQSFFELACIEYAEPSDNYNQIDNWIRKNHTYDWAFFLSKKAAEVFFERLLAIGGTFFNLSPRFKIACVGESTADYVRNEIGFPVNFVPSVFNSDCFITEFLEKFHTEPLEVVLFRNEDVKDDFQERVEDSGHIKLNICPSYKLACPQYQQDDFAEILGAQIEPIFMSSQTVRNFFEITKNLDLKISRIFSIGPKTSATIKELYPDISLIESESASLDSVLELVLRMKCH